MGIFCVGGGAAAVPLVKTQVVDIYGWLNLTEFADIITLSELTPGPFAINSAAFIGMKLYGIPGAVIATIGFLIPSIVILTVIMLLYGRLKNNVYFKGALSGLNIAVSALVLIAACTIAEISLFSADSDKLFNINILPFVIFICGFIVLKKWKTNPMFIIFAGGILSLVFNLALPHY